MKTFKLMLVAVILAIMAGQGLAQTENFMVINPGVETSTGYGTPGGSAYVVDPRGNVTWGTMSREGDVTIPHNGILVGPGYLPEKKQRTMQHEDNE